MPSKRMTGINRAERSPDSGALSALLLPHLFLLLQLHASLSTSTSTSTSSPVHPLHFALSCSTGLLKLPRWPLYLQHWSAQTFFFRKRPFWAVNRCAGTCKTHLEVVLELHTHTHTHVEELPHEQVQCCTHRCTVKHAIHVLPESAYWWVRPTVQPHTYEQHLCLHSPNVSLLSCRVFFQLNHTLRQCILKATIMHYDEYMTYFLIVRPVFVPAAQIWAVH